jgi:hypothetical protein
MLDHSVLTPGLFLKALCWPALLSWAFSSTLTCVASPLCCCYALNQEEEDWQEDEDGRTAFPALLSLPALLLVWGLGLGVGSVG